MFVSKFFWPTIRLLPLELSGDITDYEFLLKVCRKLNETITTLNQVGEQTQENKEAIEALQQDVDNIHSELEKVKNGDYVSLYLDSIINYINNNLQDLAGNIVKFIVFGLSQDGHFVAMIPSTWEFIHFNTIMDYSSPQYGHLVLQW